jgi:rare lipoprotein A
MKCVTIAVAFTVVVFSTPALAVGSQMSIIASYYGNELKGRRTASGELFNPAGHTAAHRTYPFGTCLKVSHGGKSVRVRVNDRGPWVKGRSLDLSHGAARAIGMRSTSRVRVEKC